MPDISGSANPNAKLTEDDVRKILELYAAGVRPRAIALRFHLPDGTISRIVHGKGWQHVRRSMPTDSGRMRYERQARGSRCGTAKLTEDDVVRILELRASGATFASLAKQYQVSAATIELIVYGKRWRHVPRVVPTELLKTTRDIRPKLTEDDVIKIVELLAAGITRRALADRFQVSISTITHIVLGKSWKHVPRRPPPQS